MESLSETAWDVVISGTGLQQSLLALALSRSDKKILHVDQNEYYGGAEAAFSLQEAEEWVEKVTETSPLPFTKASVWKADETTSEKLASSRAYTLTLSPQIIYSKSKLLAQLVSSKVYKHLEFQAVGNWWIYDTSSKESGELPAGTLKRIPNGREDIFSDRSIDVRAKRGVMKFLKFVVDYESQPDVWEAHAQLPLPEFLSAHFSMPQYMQSVLLALTLSLDLPSDTLVEFSLPRIKRHLTSIGVFGPGFGAVIPKYGGGAEIAQVACRAGAVGGGVYVLGTGIAKAVTLDSSRIELTLTNEETVNSGVYVHDQGADTPKKAMKSVSKVISIVSSDLRPLFATTVEGAPTAAVSVVYFPSNTLVVGGEAQPLPVYIMVHSSDTGECPPGQCVLYCSTATTDNAEARLKAAVSALIRSNAIQSIEGATSEGSKSAMYTLYQVYYEQISGSSIEPSSGQEFSMPLPSLDLSLDDQTLDHVENAWRQIMTRGGEEVLGQYMVFETREQEDDDDDNEGL